MNKVTLRNYIPNYLLNPLSKEISKVDRAICLIASIILGLLMGGLLHLGVAGYQWLVNKTKNQTHNPAEMDQQANNTGSYTLMKPFEKIQKITPKIPDALQNSCNQVEWVKNVELVIRKAKRRYTQEVKNEFEELLNQGMEVNTTDAERWIGGTMLHSIAKHGKPLEFVKILNKHKIDFNLQDNWENTALLWAIANGNNAMANEILDYDQNLNLKGLGNTALHLAVAKGYKITTIDGQQLSISNFQLIEKMLKLGADPNLINNLGYTSLHLACIRRDPDMINALIKAGANIDTLSPDKKTCAELLKTPFDEANAIINKVTSSVYLLDEVEFNENQDAYLKYFK